MRVLRISQVEAEHLLYTLKEAREFVGSGEDVDVYDTESIADLLETSEEIVIRNLKEADHEIIPYA